MMSHHGVDHHHDSEHHFGGDHHENIGPVHHEHHHGHAISHQNMVQHVTEHGHHGHEDHHEEHHVSYGYGRLYNIITNIRFKNLIEYFFIYQQDCYKVYGKVTNGMIR